MTGRGQAAIRRRHAPSWLAPVVALAAAVLAVLTVGAPAHAHSELLRSDPAAGATVAVGRTQVTLWYDEPIAVAASRFRLATEDGTRIRLDVSSPADRPTAFVELESAPLADGVLVLEWQTVSALDGHSSSGTITFGVGRPPPATGATSRAAPAVDELGLRWLQLSTLMVAVGVLVAPLVLRRAAHVVPGPMLRIMRAGPAAALAALLATLMSVAIGPDSHELGSTVVTTGWGRWWLVHAFALVVVVVGFLRSARLGWSPRSFWLVGVGLVTAAAADAAAGHAAELPSGTAVAVAVTTVHVLAVSVWIGTLGVLTVALLPAMRHPDSRRALVATVWREFSAIATVSMAAVVATGLYLAGVEIPGLGALTSTWYGAALAVKTLALAAALLVASCSTLVVHPRLAGHLARRLPLLRSQIPEIVRLPRFVAAELAMLGIAVLLGSVMTTVPTAREATADVPAQLGTTMADGLFVTFESLPATVGERRVIVRVNAVVRPQPAPVTGLDLTITDASGRNTTSPTRRVEPGRYEATVPAPATDRFHVWVSVHRRAAPDTVAEIDWSPAATGSAWSRFRIITAGASLVTGLVALAGGFVLLRRRRHHDEPPGPTDRRRPPERVPGPAAVPPRERVRV